MKISLNKIEEYELNSNIEDLLKDNDLLSNSEDIADKVCDSKENQLFQTIACLINALIRSKKKSNHFLKWQKTLRGRSSLPPLIRLMKEP